MLFDKISEEGTLNSTRKFVPGGRFIIVAIIVLGLIMSMGKCVFTPFSVSVASSNIYNMSRGEKGSIIIDDSANRLIFLDQNGYVINAKRNDLFEEKPVFYREVYAAKDAYYVAEYSNVAGGAFVGEEKVVKYSYEGEPLATVFCETYSVNDSCEDSGLISLYADDEKVYLFRNNKEESFELDSFPANLSEPDSSLVEKRDMGMIANLSSYYSAFGDIKNSHFAVTDPFGNYYEYDSDNGWIQSSEEEVLSNFEGVYIRGYEFFKSIIKTVPERIRFSAGLLLRVWYFWCSVVLFIALFIYVVIKNLSRMILDGKFETLKRIGVILAFLGVFCFLSFFFLDNLEDEYRDHRFSTFSSICFRLSEEDKEWFVNLSDRENQGEVTISVEDYTVMRNKLKLISKGQSMFGNDVNIMVLDKDKRALVDSRCFWYIGFDCSGYWDALNLFDSENELYEFEIGYVLERLCGLVKPVEGDSGEVLGYIVVFGNNDFYSRTLMYDHIRMVFELLTYMIFIIYIVGEIKTWIERRIEAADYEKKGVDNYVLLMTRPMQFLLFGSLGADTALVVVFVKDMIQGTPYENITFLISIPQIILTVGYIIGTKIYFSLAKHFNLKRILVFSMCGMGVFLVLTAVAVKLKLVIWFFLFRLTYIVFSQIVLLFMTRLQYEAPSDDIRREMINDSLVAKISGVALITIVSGYISVKYGNQAVYYVAATIGTILLAYILKIYKRLPASFEGAGEIKPQKKKATLSDLKFLINPRVLILILGGCGALGATSGFTSILFPYFADMNGMDKTLISNIQAFVMVIVFMIFTFSHDALGKIGEKKVIVGSIFLVAGAYIFNIVDKSFIILILVFAVLLMIKRMIKPSIDFSWQKKMERLGIDSDRAHETYTFCTSIMDLLASLAVGTLAGYGMNVLAIVIAGFMILVGILSLILL